MCLKLGKLILLISLLAFVVLTIYGTFKLEPHYFSSKEAFFGNLYRGKIIPFISDDEEAKKYLAEAVKKNNNIEAQCDLGEVYASEGNYKLETYYYLSAAMYGSQRCEVHFLKLSFPDYEEKTYQLLKKMADERKYPSAQFMVGKRLIEGVGISKDAKEGITYLEKAIAQDHWGAKFYLAGIYIKGELLPQDIDKANKLMESKSK